MTLFSSFPTRNMKKISIGIFSYPFALKSAVYGMEELFTLANQVCATQSIDVRFEPTIIQNINRDQHSFNVVLLPPAINKHYYLSPETEALDWLRDLHKKGSVIASACAGSFILTASGITNQRTITTHWGLQEDHKSHFPFQPIDTNKILIDHGDIMSAGGMMSWLDLALELVTRYASPAVMRQVGKMLVVDTAPREQRYYQQFTPSFLHGDSAIIELQQWINLEYSQSIQITALAKKGSMTERTLQRRFKKATGLNPNQYLQRVRIQKACDFLETTTHSFEWISSQVGYEDTTACRKVFVKIMGLTPVEFRRRFNR